MVESSDDLIESIHYYDSGDGADVVTSREALL